MNAKHLFNASGAGIGVDDRMDDLGGFTSRAASRVLACGQKSGASSFA